MDWQGILLSGFGSGIIGAWAGAFLATRFERSKARRDLAFDFYNRFILDPYFRQVSRNVAVVRENWRNGDHTILEHFLKQPGALPAETADANGLTPHANLSVVLHFGASLHVALEENLVDETLCRRLLGNLFMWNQDFYREFIAAHNAMPDERKFQPVPAWIQAIPDLALFFKHQKNLHRGW